MGTPQIIIIILYATDLAYAVFSHGKPRSDTNALSVFISEAIVIGLLLWGGFFK